MKFFFRFFVKDELGWQSSFLFALSMFLLETLMAIFVFAEISSTVRFRGFFAVENLLALGIILFFFIRVLVLYITLGFLLRLLEWIFHITWRKTFYALVITYAYLLIAIRYPQNFDDLPWVTHVLAAVKLFKFPWILAGPVLGIFFLLFHSLLTNRKISGKRIRWMKATAALSLLAVFFKVSLTPFFSMDFKEASSPQAPTLKKHPNIIFITVDSLRGDMDLKKWATDGSALQRYFSESTGFHRVISPIAQTHGALASLFTAESPLKTGFRANLSIQGLNPLVWQNSLIGNLKDNNYSIRVLKDAEEYENFSLAGFADTTTSPSYPVPNVMISTFFKNRLIFGLFDNPLGYLVLPELRDNTSFIYSYDVRRFTKKVLQNIEDINQTEKPVFLYIHTCSMHWPGVLPFPYYPQSGFPTHSNTPFSYTSKFRGLSPLRLSREEWNMQSDFNRKIYNSGAAMTVNDFLSPIFDKLYQQGLDQNSIIVLLSDHGDDFWDSSQRYPFDKFSQHGTSLLFGASSENSFLRMNFPGFSNNEVKQTVGIIDILPTVFDFVGLPAPKTEGTSFLPLLQNPKAIADKMYYTETGLWPFGMFKGQFTAVPAAEMGPLLRINSQAKIYVDPRFMPGIVQQKQRAIHYGPYRYTLYPTTYGYMDFLCDRERDFFCQKNLSKDLPQVAKKMSSTLYNYINQDVKTGLLKVGACSTLPNSPKEIRYDGTEEYQWQYFYQALECMSNFHDYEYAVNIFKTLFVHPDVNQSLKKRIKSNLFFICASSERFTEKNFPSFLLEDLSVLIANEQRIPNLGFTRHCLEKIHAISLLALLPSAPDQEDIDLGDSESFESINSYGAFQSLLQQYIQSSGNDSRLLLEEIENHPSRKYYQTAFELAEISKNTKYDMNLRGKLLDDYFKVEIDYNLAEVLTGYYFRRLDLLSENTSSQALIYLLDQLSSDRVLPLVYYDVILSRIDDIIHFKETKRRAFRQVRLNSQGPWNKQPINWKKIELEVILDVSERHFGCSQSNSDVCRKILSFRK